MNKISKISIVTPCFNAEKYIHETIHSIVNQSAVLSGRVELEYFICDGNSSDNTVNIAQSFNHPSIKIISEKDSGMYDALSKGLKLCSGQITAYLNAGDLYYPRAFDVVLDIMEKQKVDWITGLKVHYNESSQVISATLPFRYRSKYILSGQYGKNLPYIQQESTFWKTENNKLIDFEKLSKYRLAGDYYMWHSFASANIELFIVESFLGGFKKHHNQLSSALDKYELEQKSISKINFWHNIISMFDRIIWMMPHRIKKYFNKRNLLRYDTQSECWK